MFANEDGVGGKFPRGVSQIKVLGGEDLSLRVLSIFHWTETFEEKIPEAKKPVFFLQLL